MLGDFLRKVLPGEGILKSARRYEGTRNQCLVKLPKNIFSFHYNDVVNILKCRLTLVKINQVKSPRIGVDTRDRGGQNTEKEAKINEHSAEMEVTPPS